jgi:hypothetical protein
VYLAIVAVLVSTNIFVMVFYAAYDMIKAIKRKLFIKKRDRILALNKLS